jgi:hypothetical protein
MKFSELFSERAGGGFMPPRFRFSGADGSYSHEVSTRDARDGHYIRSSMLVPFGTKLVMDLLSILGGWLSYVPYDDSRLFPLPYDAAEALAMAGPRPGPNFFMVVRVPVYLEGMGLAQWTVGGVIAQNAIATVRKFYQYSAEGTRGQLPVVVLMPSRQIEIRSRNNERHFVPVLEIVGWVKRDDGTFGPPLIRPPPPILSGTAAPPQLAPPPANDDAQASPPWDNNASPNPATSVPANDAVAIANDVFASMTPAAADTGKPKF